MAPKGAVVLKDFLIRFLAAKTVQSASLAFERVNHVHGGDSLTLGVFGVCNSITDHILKKNFENTTGLFVDQTRDSLNTTTASETTDGRFGDALDVVTKDLTMTLGASFSKTLSSFTTTRHVAYRVSIKFEQRTAVAALYTTINDLSGNISVFRLAKSLNKALLKLNIPCYTVFPNIMRLHMPSYYKVHSKKSSCC